MILIGITGTIGSGKGTVVKYLQEQYDFQHYSARAFISEEVNKRGLPQTRENMRIIANELRTQHGSSFVAEGLYEQAIAANTNAVLESLRSPGEIEALRNKPERFYLLAVDADLKIRFKRITERKSSTDLVPFEKFMDDAQKEMNDPNPGGMRLAECIRIADGKIENNGSIEELHKAIDEFITPLLDSAK
jgi:dephospho-CoA kinase